TTRILVVDDNTAIHRDFQKILAGGESRAELEDLEQDLFGGAASSVVSKQYSLACAESGQEALKLVQRANQQGKPFALAFVDMRMPGWDGIETVAQLLRVQPDLQVAICSAYMDYSWHDVISRLNRPGLRLLRKPWTSGEVLALVHELCGRVGRVSRFPAKKLSP
ncbi:MAG TPA: response regulator, partial [Polyangiaceae bacterium]|nr:response regulator [Polyangiaceae bacterium]